MDHRAAWPTTNQSQSGNSCCSFLVCTPNASTQILQFIINWALALVNECLLWITYKRNGDFRVAAINLLLTVSSLCRHSRLSLAIMQFKNSCVVPREGRTIAILDIRASFGLYLLHKCKESINCSFAGYTYEQLDGQLKEERCAKIAAPLAIPSKLRNLIFISIQIRIRSLLWLEGPWKLKSLREHFFFYWVLK